MKEEIRRKREERKREPHKGRENIQKVYEKLTSRNENFYLKFSLVFSVLEMVSFSNTINYLATQMNNETSLKKTQRKVYYSSRCKGVRVTKCPFWCRRLVCWSLSL